MTTATSVRPAPPGWVPRRHGAWPMLAVPLVVGAAIAGWQPVHVPLAIVWLLGFLTFEATGGRLESRAGSAVPALTYAAAALAAGAAVLVLEPALAIWLPLVLPQVGLGLWTYRSGRSESLLNSGSAVLVASLMLPIAFDAGTEGTFVALGGEGMDVWVAFAVVLAYFFGTALFATTMLGDSGRRYYAASIGFHAVALVIMRVLAMSTRVLHPVSLVLLFGALVMRAAVLPRMGGTPLQVALTEAGAAIAVAAVLLLQLT